MISYEGQAARYAARAQKIRACRTSERGAQPMAKTLFSAVAAFVATNLDDLFLLMLLFGQARDGGGRRRVVAGQYLGMGALTTLSLLGAWGAWLLPRRAVALLGLAPLALGIKAWRDGRKDAGDGADDAAGRGLSVFAVALLTVANGGDNIGVYLPVFSGYSAAQMGLAAAAFAALTGLWCAAGAGLAALPRVKGPLHRCQRVLVPLVLVGLGLFILLGGLLQAG